MGSFGNPRLAALEAVGAAEDAGLVGVWASSANGPWTLCVWNRPDLFIVDGTGPRVLWRHHRLPNLLTPRGLALHKSLEGATAIPHGPLVHPFPEAHAALDLLGLSGPQPPNSCGE
jgi:hypothetical protein